MLMWTSLPTHQIYVKLVLVVAVYRNVSKSDMGPSSPVFPVVVLVSLHPSSLAKTQNLGARLTLTASHRLYLESDKLVKNQDYQILQLITPLLPPGTHVTPSSF